MNFFLKILLILISFFFSCSFTKKNKELKPNILLIVADDLGYTDLGCFGSEISTPNINNLSKNGITFTNFHTSPLCATTRAMLLSGMDNHIAGIGIQGYNSDLFGYEGKLSNRIKTIPSILNTSDYYTFISGKWHLGGDLESDPIKNGFDESYVLLPGAGNHYSNRKVIEVYPDSSYSENGKKTVWKLGNYSTDYFTDKIIEYISNSKTNNKPFFAFATYTSPHWPLQVDEKFTDKYEGIYNSGYDKLKEERFKNLKKLNIISSSASLPKSHQRLKPWNDLSNSDKKIESKKMELYAGMIENLDFNIGRIINYLKKIDEYENTLIVFMSDNGAAAEDFYNNPIYGPYLKNNFSVEYDDMGKENSFISLGTGWAEASSAPFKFFKGLPTQGGIVSPLIISGYGVGRKDYFSKKFITLLDIAPTLYDFGKIDFKNNNFDLSLQGSSLKKYLSGKNNYIHKKGYVFGFEHSGYCFIMKDNWKLVNYESPFDINNFELYNLKNDPIEEINLKEKEVKIFNDLLYEWNVFSKKNKLILPTPYIDNIN